MKNSTYSFFNKECWEILISMYTKWNRDTKGTC